MRIHYLQHVSFEGPANIVNWAYNKGHKFTGTHLYNYETVPAMGEFDCLIIMGGPMNIYEEEKYPWLKYEKQFIKEAIEYNKIVIGICLGAQLITEVLGGKVTQNTESEIGWFPISFSDEALKSPLFETFPEITTVFQWHNDTFSTLGEGAICIASNKICEHQAFIYKDRVIGFQFHMESSEASIFSLIDNCYNENNSGSYVQSKEAIKSGMKFLKPANTLMEDFLNRLEAHYLKQR